jgi:hypothetical protein
VRAHVSQLRVRRPADRFRTSDRSGTAGLRTLSHSAAKPSKLSAASPLAAQPTVR